MKRVYYLSLSILCYITLIVPVSFSQHILENNLPAFVEERLGKGWIQDIEFSPNGDNFAVATTIGIWIYNSRTGSEVHRFEGIMGGANAISYSPDGRYIAAAHQDRTIRLWDLIRRHQDIENNTLIGHNRKIYDLTYSPDDSCISPLIVN